MVTHSAASPRHKYIGVILLILVVVAGSLIGWLSRNQAPSDPQRLPYESRRPFDSSGFTTIAAMIPSWPANSSLESIASSWRRVGYRQIADIDAFRDSNNGSLSLDSQTICFIQKASLLNYEGEAEKAYAVLEEARTLAASDREVAVKWLYTIIYFQGVTALRK